MADNNKETMSHLPKAKLHEPRRRLSLIWMVPILAALAAGWLVFESVRKTGPTLIIDFADGSGVKANQTVLRYRGVQVGEVRSVSLTKDAKHVEVVARLDQSAASLARAGTLFWIVRPQVSAGGLRGLETIVSGSYIQIRPGDGQPTTHYTGLEHGPSAEAIADSLEVTLVAPDAGSLASGSPIYFRGMEVGAVQTLTMSKDTHMIIVHAAIDPSYASLVCTNTQFWNAGGVNVDLHLFGVNFRAETFKSLLAGGIAFKTPSPAGPPAPAGSIFPLYSKEPE